MLRKELRWILLFVVFTFTIFGFAFFAIPTFDLPYEGEKNANTAYEWYIETNNVTHNYPSCSLQARHYIDEYRNHNNLTYIQFPCAIWLNDMSDWFYY